MRFTYPPYGTSLWQMASYIWQDELAFGRWPAPFDKMSWPFASGRRPNLRGLFHPTRSVQQRGRVDKLRASTERKMWWMRFTYPPYGTGLWQMASCIRQDEPAFGRWPAPFDKMSWPFASGRRPNLRGLFHPTRSVQQRGRVDKLRASTERKMWWMRFTYPPYGTGLWQMASYIWQDELAIWQDELAFGKWLATFGKMSWPFDKMSWPLANG